MSSATLVAQPTGREATAAREFATFSEGEVLELGASGTNLTVRRIDRREGYVVTEVTKLGSGEVSAEMHLNQSIRLGPSKKDGSWIALDGPKGMNQLYLLVRENGKSLGTVRPLYE